MRRYLLLVLFYSLVVGGFTQDKTIDSLQNIISAIRGDKYNTARITVLIGNAHRRQKNFSEAFKYYSNAQQLYKTVENKQGVAECFSLIGSTYSAQENFAEALEYYYKGIRIYEELKDKQKIATSLSKIGWAHQLQGGFEEALKNYQGSLSIWKELGNKLEVVRLTNSIGSNYHMMGKHQQALESHLHSLDIARKLPGAKSLLGTTLSRLGQDYEELANVAEKDGQWLVAQNQYNEALKHYAEALELNDEGLTGKGDIYWHYGSIYTKLKKYDLARDNLEKALKLYKQSNFKPFIALTYESLSTLDSLEGNFEKAYEHHKASVFFYSSFLNDENFKKTTYLKLQYQFDKKEDSLKLQQQLTDEKLKQQRLLAIQQQQELKIKDASLQFSKQQRKISELAFLRTEAELQTEQTQRQEKEKQLQIVEKEKSLQLANLKLKTAELHLKEREINSKKMQRNIIVAGAFAILIFGVVLWRNNKNKLRAYNLLEKQKMRTQIASDLHDDIGSTLTSISYSAELVKMELPGEDLRVKNMLDKIGNNARTIVDTMSDIVWVINPDNDITENLVRRMRNHATEQCNDRNIEYYFEAGNDTADLKLNMQQRKNLYFIFKEAVHNAVKYACCSKINISLLQTDNEIQLIVKDNGKGFDFSKAKEGNGLINMKRRAEEIKGILNLETWPNKGTSVSCKLKITPFGDSALL